MQYTKETEVFGGMTSEDQLLSNPTPDEENTQEKKDELFEKVMKALPLQNEKANEVIIRNQSNENHSPNKVKLA